jgi:6-pyruvoyltetrahydropterin/6-carboxytetrahydropterin synthase
MAGYKVHRYHDISCGHRVHGHEGKCRHLHGHNYRVHFTCIAEDGALDGVGPGH